MSKHDLRRLMKAKLSLLDVSVKTNKSSSISKNLESLLSELHVIQKKICIGTFAPIAHEPLWYLELSEEYQKLTSYPAYDTETKVMTFKMARMSDLKVKKDFGYDILGPSEDAAESKPDVILIPGLAFSKKGERLGRGKGFYDKYLSEYRGVKIGICFEVQLIDQIPTEIHDVHLDFIVTEERIIKCKLA